MCHIAGRLSVFSDSVFGGHNEEFFRLFTTHTFIKIPRERIHVHKFTPRLNRKCRHCIAIRPKTDTIRCKSRVNQMFTIDIERGRAVLLTADGMRELSLPPKAPFYAPWLLAQPPRGEKAAPDEATLRAFRLTREALLARNAADESES